MKEPLKILMVFPEPKYVIKPTVSIINYESNIRIHYEYSPAGARKVMEDEKPDLVVWGLSSRHYLAKKYSSLPFIFCSDEGLNLPNVSVAREWDEVSELVRILSEEV